MLAVLTAAVLMLSVAAVDLPKAVRVDPGGATLPANALRLYVWFDRPARLLVDARDVRLLDAGGAAIRGAFMDFGQALWSPDGRRLTLLFDPGRVKRDVEGSGDSVAPLVVGRTYQIAVGDLRWRFTVAPAIRNPLEPSSWAIAAPKVATRNPLAIHFGRTMDAALLVSRLSVVGAEGATVRGQAIAEAGAARGVSCLPRHGEPAPTASRSTRRSRMWPEIALAKRSTTLSARRLATMATPGCPSASGAGVLTILIALCHATWP